MKRTFFILLLAAVAIRSYSQLNPVSWSYSSKKIDDKKYEVHITATIQPGWHLYSQIQPEDAIAEPTAISFNKNPLLSLDGKIKEDGKMEKFHDATLDLSANQFSKKVDFIQVVKLKAKARTNMSGTVRYQTCNDEKCLPPKTITFSVAL